MDLIKKLFPLSFKYKKSVVDLIVGIVLYLIAGAVGGVVIWLASLVPIVGWLFGIIGGLLDLYVAVGVVILILAFLKIVK